MSQILRTNAGLIGVLLGVAALVALSWKHLSFVHDDIYISLRYAANFAETGLLQWNSGEWVEGYTSLLHVALSSLGIRAGLDALLAARVLNALASVGIVLAAYFGARALRPDEDTSTLVPGLVALTVGATHPIAIWLVGGLETTLIAALLLAGIACLLAHLNAPRIGLVWLAAVFFGFAVITRLDAAVFIAGSGLGLLLAGREALPRRLGAAVLVVGLPAAVAFVQMAIRLQVYGEVFPLTFYAKVDLPLGLRLREAFTYFVVSRTDVPVLGLAAILGVIALLSGRLSRPAVLLSAPIALHAVYVLWAGGDHMPQARMLVILLAPAVLLVAALGYAIWRPAATGLMALVAAGTVAVAVDQPRLRADNAAFVGRIVGDHVAQTWPRDILIATNSAGAVVFFARDGRRFIDMLGLNDPVIAKRENVPVRTLWQTVAGHAKGDGAYVLSRAPDRIIIGPAAGVDISEAADWFLTGVELNEIPEFHACYEKQVETITHTARRDLRAWDYGVPAELPFTFYVRRCSPDVLAGS